MKKKTLWEEIKRLQSKKDFPETREKVIKEMTEKYQIKMSRIIFKPQYGNGTYVFTGCKDCSIPCCKDLKNRSVMIACFNLNEHKWKQTFLSKLLHAHA
jgi:hypothetical protein